MLRIIPVLSFAALALISLQADAAFKPRKIRAQAVPAVERYPNARCEHVKESVVADLPAFCQAEPLDKVRLVDFGGQLDVLEGSCKDMEFATHLKQALGQKAHRHDAVKCKEIAADMSRSLKGGIRTQAAAEKTHE